MAIILNDNLKINVGKPVDSKYLNGLVPYVNIAEVNSVIPIAERYVGLTVNIVNEEYWYKDGVADGQLVEKITASGGTGLAGIQNIGTGTGLIYSGLSGTTAELRSISGSGDTVVTTSDSEIIIFSQFTGATGQPIYTGATPSNIDAGGMVSGTTLTGKTLSELIEDIATTVYNPTLVAPSNLFTDDQTATKEVGITLGTINFTATFDRGLITPPYGTSGFRSGSGNTYNYTGTDLPASVASTLATDLQTINNYVILAGANTWTSSVTHDIGEQPKDSAGGNYDSPYPAGTTGAAANTITGLYPWFYGKVAGGVRPTANQALINSFDTKLVAASTGSIAANYNAVGEWIWFAIPQASTSKIKWEGSNSPSNNGAIGGAVSGGGNLFPDPDVVSINSPSAYWTSISYKIYISNFATSTYDSGSPYTLTFKNS